LRHIFSSLLNLLSYFAFLSLRHSSRDHRHLHSFPTRRSSDLEEGDGDAERDEQHHPRLAALQLADGTGEERGAAPGVHDGAEDCGDPACPAGHGVPEEHGEHGGERDHLDGDDDVDPEQPAELADVVAVARMTTMTTAVIAVPGVVTVFHGVAVVLGVRVVNVAGLGGRDTVVVMVMVMRGRVRHCSSLPSFFPGL